MMTLRESNRFGSDFGYGRFIIDIGDMSTVLADELPNAGQLRYSKDVHIWDIQEDKAAVTIHAAYANSICLELPLEEIANHLNCLTNEELESEGLTVTDVDRISEVIKRIERHLS